MYLVACATIYQYLPHLFKCKRSICEQFAVLFTIAIVWAYAEILTAAGAYDKRPDSTQLSCRTDRSGLISASPWSAHFPFRFPLFQDKNRGYFFLKDFFYLSQGESSISVAVGTSKFPWKRCIRNDCCFLRGHCRGLDHHLSSHSWFTKGLSC